MAKGMLKHISSLLLNTAYACCILWISSNIFPLKDYALFEIGKAAFIFALSYNAIYYINSYSDRFEDKGVKSVNIYLDKLNKYSYWGAFVITIYLSSTFLVTWFPANALLLYWGILLYQVLYSLKPVRLKRLVGIRYVALGVFYVLKTMYVFSLFNITITLNAVILLSYLFLLVTVGSMVYKTKFNKKRKPLPKVGFSTSLLVMIAFTVLAYWWFGTNWLQVILGVGLYLLSSFFIMGTRELIIKRIATLQK